MEGKVHVASNRSLLGTARESDARGRSAFTPFVWGSGFLIFLFVACWFRPIEWIWPQIERGPLSARTLLGLMSKYPLIVAPLGAVFLVVAGLLGGSLGVPGLFRTPPCLDLEKEKRRRRDRDYLHSRGRMTAF